jgi:ribokinase
MYRLLRLLREKEAMSPKIVVVGSANTDMVVQVAHLPAQGETVLGGKFVTAQGGKGANQAVAAARLGAQVTFVARLGRDAFGQGSAAAYQANGINTDYIAWDDQVPSGVALIMVNESGQNIIAVAPGANGRLAPDDVMAAERAFKDADGVLLQLEIPLEAVGTAIKLARRYGVRVIVNPAPATPLPDELLKSIDILTPNEGEVAVLTRKYSTSDTPDAALCLYHHGGVQTLVVTRGAKGALVIDHGEKSIVPGFAVKPVDTTGAGDAFNAALAVALGRGEQLVEAVRYANAVGALAVTRLGAQSSLPTEEQVRQFLSTSNANR